MQTMVGYHSYQPAPAQKVAVRELLPEVHSLPWEGQSMTTASDVDKAEGNITTLMFRNLPRRYTANALANELAEHVHRSAIDFLYVPFGTRASDNIGFAFVNFVDPETATMIQRVLNGKPWSLVRASRPITILAAHIQGFYNNLAHCAKAITPDAAAIHLPWIFENGEPVAFAVAVQRCLGQPCSALPDKFQLQRMQSPQTTKRSILAAHRESMANCQAPLPYPWQPAPVSGPPLPAVGKALGRLTAPRTEQQATQPQPHQVMPPLAPATACKAHVCPESHAPGSKLSARIDSPGLTSEEWTLVTRAFSGASQPQPLEQVAHAQFFDSSTTRSSMPLQPVGIVTKEVPPPQHRCGGRPQNQGFAALEGSSSTMASPAYQRASQDVQSMLQQLVQLYA